MDATVDRVMVQLVPHDPAWALAAQAECARLAAAIGDTLLTIHHVGSTAIPGICAKPILDLLPVVRSIAVLDQRGAALERLGYILRGEFGLPGRRYCVRNDAGTGRRLVQLHCYQEAAAEIQRMLDFRDYLRAHPDEAQQYEAEKHRAAALHPDDVLAYNDVKAPWIRAARLRARDWADRRGR